MRHIGDLDQQGTLRDVIRYPLDDSAGTAAPDRVGDEVVAITLVPEGEEDRAGLRDPRVEGAAGEAARRVRVTPDHPSPARLEESSEREHAPASI